ncbi:MAG: nucleotidyltransferase domain-containing protein, partial [Rhodobiaceae bacterium]|nr:nucleotidyltransferase domain-containing protein [Rhodobiaceae bacterium]
RRQGGGDLLGARQGVHRGSAAAGAGYLMNFAAVPGLGDSELAALRDWAANDIDVDAVWIIGSRAKGTHNRNSDVDVAIRAVGHPGGDRLAAWICAKSRWQQELQDRIQHRLHLLDADSEEYAAKAVAEHGILVWPTGV